MDKYGVPRIAFVNKMDRVGADFLGVVRMMHDRLGTNAVPIQLPVGEGDIFSGVIDLVTMRARMYRDSSLGDEWDEIEIPHDMQTLAAEYRTKMLEAVSEEDDTLLEKYLEGHEITPEEIMRVLRQATLKVTIVPVLCGSSFKNKGVQKLLDGIVQYLPSPTDLNEGVVWGHHMNLTDHISRKVTETEKFTALAFKIVTDPFVGKLTYFRVYTGSLKSGSYVYNPVSDKKERISRILRMHANTREDVDVANAGDIVAAVGLKHTRTGDTLLSRIP